MLYVLDIVNKSPKRNTQPMLGTPQHDHVLLQRSTVMKIAQNPWSSNQPVAKHRTGGNADEEHVSAFMETSFYEDVPNTEW